MIKKFYLFFLFICCFITSLAIIAEEELSNYGEYEDEFGGLYGNEAFINIATGTSQLISKAPAAATIITRQDIEALGATHLNEVLERIPGLHVMPSNLSRFDSVYSFRGIQTGFNPQTLILLNGTEFKNSFTGGLPFTFRLPTTAIERIEVIRGPGSAVYGADAYSGVINIITKSHTSESDHHLSVGGRVGSFSTRDVWLETNIEYGEWYFYTIAEQQRSDGDRGRIVHRDAQSTLDDILGTNASLAPGAYSTDYDISHVLTKIQYQDYEFEGWFWKQDHGGLGPGASQALDRTGFQDVEFYRLKLSHHYQLNEQFTLATDTSYLRTNQNSFFNVLPAGVTVPIDKWGDINFANSINLVNFPDGIIGNPSSIHDDHRINSALYWHLSAEHDLRFAVGYLSQALRTKELKNFGRGVIDGTQNQVSGNLQDVTNTDFIYLPNQERHASYVSIQDEWRLQNDWVVTLGIRYDDFSNFGYTINPRVALVWETTHNLTTKFLYGSAFRAPSFTEQFLQNNPVNLGNQEIDPETIDTYEIAFDYRPDFGKVWTLSLFHYTADDLITVVRQENTSTYENARSQKGYGAELTYEHEINNSISYHTNYSFQDSKNKQNNAAIADAPRHQFYLDVRWQMNNNIKSAIELIHIANRKRAQGDLRSEIGDYSLVNLYLNYANTDGNWYFGVKVNNLFDGNHFEPSNGDIAEDYILAGRQILFHVEYHF